MNTRWFGETVASIDMFLSLFVIMAGLALLVVPAKPAAQMADKAICSLTIDTEWSAEQDVDVDVWAQAGKDHIVGYSSPHGQYLDLVRDDLGTSFDTTTTNSERICGRGYNAGEYVVNVHLYTVRSGTKPPVPVRVIIAKVDPATATRTILWEGSVELRHMGEELTVARFFLTDHGVLDGTISRLPKPLRAQVK